jgi:hypothetical protein
MPHQEAVGTHLAKVALPQCDTSPSLDDFPQIQRGPPMMSEENLLTSMNLREKQERLDSVFDFMRRL